MTSAVSAASWRPSFRRSGLDDNWPASDGASNVQRPPHGKMGPFVVQHVHLLGVEINARLNIADEGVVRPTVPQAGDNIEELARTTIALSMLQVFLASEVHRLARVGRGNDVPTRASPTDMIKRGEFSRDMIRLIIGRRCGGYRPQMLGHHGEGRKQRNGSKDVTVALRFSAFIGMFITAR